MPGGLIFPLPKSLVRPKDVTGPLMHSYKQAMKNKSKWFCFLLIVLLVFISLPMGLARKGLSHSDSTGIDTLEEGGKQIVMISKSKEQLMRQITGSALSVCKHACGGCSQCRRVFVSFKYMAESEAYPWPIDACVEADLSLFFRSQ